MGGGVLPLALEAHIHPTRIGVPLELCSRRAVTHDHEANRETHAGDGIDGEIDAFPRHETPDDGDQGEIFGVAQLCPHRSPPMRVGEVHRKRWGLDCADGGESRGEVNTYRVVQLLAHPLRAEHDLVGAVDYVGHDATTHTERQSGEQPNVAAMTHHL